MLSVIIPTNKDPYIQNTINSLLSNARGEIEILVALDNYIPDPPIESDPRVRIISSPKIQGRRSATNAGIANARGEFIMKCDNHCAFGPGYDKIMTKSCAANWLMVPRFYRLNEKKWSRDKKQPAVDYYYLGFPTKNDNYVSGIPVQNWFQMAEERKDSKYNIDDLMTFQGSCWFANKEYFLKRVGFLNDSPYAYGSFVDEPHEIGLKYWLGGGMVKTIKITWYAHLIKWPDHYRLGMYTRKHKKNFEATFGPSWSAIHWLNNEEPGMIHHFSWLLEKFWPVPSWPDDRKLWVFPETQIGINNTKYLPTKLCKLGMKYKSDKCPQFGHCYTPFYYDFLKKRQTSIKKVLVVGADDIGADLRMWGDFFPNAQIFGSDIIGKRIFENDRISAFRCDQKNKKDIKRLISMTGSNIDLVIDSASDHIHDQSVLFKTLMPLLNKKVIYIVENCWRTRQMHKAFPQYSHLIPVLLANENNIRDGLIIFTNK